jgi:hypothetical protein
MEEYYFKGRESVAVVHIIQEISAAFPAIFAFFLSVHLQLLVQVSFLREGLLATRITTGEGTLLRMNP